MGNLSPGQISLVFKGDIKLGSYPTKIREKVAIEDTLIKYIIGKEEVTYNEAKAVIRSILQETLDLTLEELQDFIDTKVPKRTGQLRDNLARHILSSRVTDTALKLRYGTGVDYASYVNEMTTEQVRHHGEKGYAYYYGHAGPIILNDPEAIGHFFDKMGEYAHERILTNYEKIKQKYANR